MEPRGTLRAKSEHCWPSFAPPLLLPCYTESSHISLLFPITHCAFFTTWTSRTNPCHCPHCPTPENVTALCMKLGADLPCSRVTVQIRKKSSTILWKSKFVSLQPDNTGRGPPFHAELFVNLSMSAHSFFHALIECNQHFGNSMHLHFLPRSQSS